MIDKKYYPVIVSAFAAAVLTTVPGLKSFSCCLLVPAASVFALFLDKKMNGFSQEIKASKALITGLLTGILLAIMSSSLEIFITFILKSNELTEALPEVEILMTQMELGPVSDEIVGLLRKISDEIIRSGFSPIFAFFLFLSNIVTNAIFGMLGGLLGMTLINRNSQQE